MINSEDIIKTIEKKLDTFEAKAKTQNIGTVEKVTDGVISASGLSEVAMGEKVTIGAASGFILNLDEDAASIILLTETTNVKEGDTIKRTEKMLTVNVSDEMLGRVINPLGDPLDGKARIRGNKEMPMEKIAPGVVAREPVNTPLKTGIKAIDSMTPIGRGQRELIIGDRGLGKTAIAIDTIINQSRVAKGKNAVISIYVAIGQKQSTVARVIQKLKDEGAMDNTIIVVAGASDQASLQYLAPYAGTAIAEYFMDKGRDVLVVYDDLTKHAWAYRQLSLVLKRPAGREAYPGDIFYLHSRLLERSVKLNKKHGGGSITALPIIETQAGDISAYIPTNVISITDGQIYLLGELFNGGIRPAIDVGNSVSRVGGAAQTPGLKSFSGKLRIDLAQYRELAVFAQFGSELDPQTMAQLERGKRTTEILKQPQYQPLAESFEILSIWAVTTGHLDDIPVEEIQRFEDEYHEYVKRHHEKVIKALEEGEKPNTETIKLMEKSIQEFKKTFSA